MRSIDKNPLHTNLLLSIPLREGTGTVTQDIAKPHHPLTIVGGPTWTQLTSGVWVLDMTPTDYIRCLAASCADLDITGNLSLVAWVYPDSVANKCVISRWTAGAGWMLQLESDGTYLYCSASQVSAPVATVGAWQLLGASRVDNSTDAHIYSNGMNATSGSVARTAVSTVQDLAIGVQSDLASNGFDGKIGGVRVWNRYLYPWEHKAIFDQERHLFGI